jgi:hypothetical protein
VTHEFLLYTERRTSLVEPSAVAVTGAIIPDGQGGVLATWTISPVNPPVPQYPYQAADIVAGVVGMPYNLPFSPITVTFGNPPTLVLGESGTAFATNGTDTVNGPVVASFGVSSGSVNWSYQAGPQFALSIIEATSGNRLVAKTTDQSGIDTVLVFNSSGVQGQARRVVGRLGPRPMVGGGLSGFSNLDYYSGGWWLGSTGGAYVAVLGNVIQSAMSSFPQIHGNGPKQNARVPVLWNFEAFDPAPPTFTAAGFEGRYDATPTLSKLTRGEFKILGAATWQAFQAQIVKPTDAVAFIGHSFSDGNPSRAIGLCFFNYQCVEREAVPGDPEYAPGFEGYLPDNVAYPTMTVAYPAPGLVTQSKIIFISACDMDVNMQNWFGVTSATVGRALVVPQNPTDVPMRMGEYAWEHIAQHLNDFPGVTLLSTAVAAANVDINGQTWQDSNGNPVAAVNWKVIGDGTVHF